MQAPTPEDVLQALGTLEARDQKIVAGLLGLMMQNAPRVRDREWMAQQLTEVTILAGGFEAESPDAGVEVVREFLQANAARLLEASLLLFQRVGLDLAPRAAEGFTFEEALRCGLAYLPSIETAGGHAARADDGPPPPRDLGEQPIARLMAERGLEPRDLVDASGEQLTYKMVTRAMKGRRLTANTMGKVQRAWNRAAASDRSRGELFSYEPIP